jgi:hypothetical protein
MGILRPLEVTHLYFGTNLWLSVAEGSGGGGGGGVRLFSVGPFF